MILKTIRRILGNKNDRILKRIKNIVNNINNLEPEIKKLNDKELSYKTEKFRKLLRKNVTTIDNILPEAFAVVREASRRVFGMRHFDVQIMGGIVLNHHCIAEMRTGEGKTLTATLPAYLNALDGKGVHIVTVNDYLAKRDAENNKPLFEFLGLSVGINLPGLLSSEKKDAYNADITYGTNNEYGFDYLRDNMAIRLEDKVQRSLNYAIIDEVDSILIDEARTPLIISSSIEEDLDIYKKINKLIVHFIRQEKEDSENFQGSGHFSVDEKSRQINLTERGLILIEKLLLKFKLIKKNQMLYSSKNIILVNYFTSALRAHNLFYKNVDYIVRNNEVIIVDEHTGRAIPGRRWSDGLHQAIEAKEDVKINSENQTLASITFQNYFRLYKKLSGMTGTAYTESFEFKSIYNLNTIVIPTNKPMIRQDFSDLIYMTEEEKINAIINDIKNCIKKKQPVLVGTISIEKSEIISKKLKKIGINHKILNAKFHAMEAEIIAQAGKPGSVTIATNMAGRGTDIILGGNWQAEIKKTKLINKKIIKKIKDKWKISHHTVKLAGGLHIIGTERHESRRIDNQLRGRSGRQGDPGSSRFYLSMEDNLMRIFASEKISNMMKNLGMKFGEAIEHPWINKAIANAQHKVESRNFSIRKQLLEYDDIANNQRRAIYKYRNEILESKNKFIPIDKVVEDVFLNIIESNTYKSSLKNDNYLIEINKIMKNNFNLDVNILKISDKETKKRKINITIMRYYKRKFLEKYKITLLNLGKSFTKKLIKKIMIKKLDDLWKEHISAMEYLRQGIHLRSYAQKDPKQEYQRESFLMFCNMLNLFKYEIISEISKLKIKKI